MKLAIAVVYLFDAENERLLDLHLSQIFRYTTVPFTVYAAGLRLPPEYREKLKSHPAVTLCNIPEITDLPGVEHAYYLDNLIRIASDEGATHIVTLHLDSFPVSTGWEKELASNLSESTPIATIDGPYTACLFFSADFYREHRPALRISREDRWTPEIQRFAQRTGRNPHSGSNYVFVAEKLGLNVHYLRANANRVFGEVIFHFGGGRKAHAATSGELERRLVRAFRRFRRFVPGFVAQTVGRVGLKEWVKSNEMSVLLDDFDAYLKDILDPEPFAGELRQNGNDSITSDDSVSRRSAAAT